MTETMPLWGPDLADFSRELGQLARRKHELVIELDELIRAGKFTREDVCERMGWKRSTWFRKLKEARWVVLGQAGDGRSLRDRR